MAKKKEKVVKDIEVKEEIVVVKKQPKTKNYPLKVRFKVSGVWREIGDTIGLTESQYRDFHNKKIV